jgi:hypothetical protein
LKTRVGVLRGRHESQPYDGRHIPRMCHPPGQRCPMQRHNQDLRNRHLAVARAKVGEGLRARHDLMEPLTPRLVELLQQLDAEALDRETARARLYADLDEGIATMVHSAPRKLRE